MPGLEYFHITNTLEYSDANRRLGTYEVQIEKNDLVAFFFCGNQFVRALKGKNITPVEVRHPRGSIRGSRKVSDSGRILDFRRKDHENDGRMDSRLTDCGLDDIFRDRKQTGCLSSRHRFDLHYIYPTSSWLTLHLHRVLYQSRRKRFLQIQRLFP